MILYFSGTGNTKFAAELLADSLHDEIVSINQGLKSGDDSFEFRSELPFIICFPVYAWNIPPVVSNFVARTTFSGTNKMYFVATMGANSGHTDKACEKLAVLKRCEYKGFRGVVMPDNCITIMNCKTEDEAAPIIAAGATALKQIAEIIAVGDILRKNDTTRFAGIKSSFVNSLFVSKAMSSDDYLATPDCVSCGKCVEVCPLNNIAIEEGKVKFGPNCTACYACIHHCPQNAIEVKGKTEGRNRYLCPSYHEWVDRQ